MLLLRNGRVIDPASGTDAVLDVCIADGRIERIGERLPADGCEVIDADGLVVAPGLIDTHVHFREPGQTHKETIDTGARAAQGGFTTVLCMANTSPPVDNAALLRENLEKGRRTGIHVLQAGAISVGLQGKALTDFAVLKRAGAVCLTDDGLPLMDADLVREAMRRAKALGLVLSFHEEDPAHIGAPGVNAGEVAREFGHAGASATAEDVLVERDCTLARETGARIVIQHVSSGAAIDAIHAAQRAGASVFAEVTPHHFSLTEEAVRTHGTLAKMNPPLRTEADRYAILEALRVGTIGIIATDHAPHTPEEKGQPLNKAPSGIIGLETALALGITNLVRTEILTLPELLAKMTVNPARCYGLDAGTLREGGPADLVLFSPREEWTVESFASKSRNSPFLGTTLYGQVHRTICAGKVVYSI